MKVFHKINENKNLAIALGYFDGIHIGHRKIIKTLIKCAKENGLRSAVITFEKNPANYFNSKTTPDIQNFKDKEMILESMGLDYLYELNFEEYKNLRANEYLKDVLIKNLAPKFIIVGYNHTFGKGKDGDGKFLKEMSKNYNYECLIVPKVQLEDKTDVSSTIIRKKIEQGELDDIKTMLDRSYTIRNSIIKGKKIARTLGLPTANMLWPDNLAKLPYGVYFGFIQFDSFMKPALISWGNKPTLTDGREEILETHVYNYNENLYGKIVNILFAKKLRDEENFKNILVLKTQLQKDYAHFEKWIESLNLQID